MDVIHVSRVLRRSRHSWANFYSGELKTYMIYVFTFDPLAKDKIHNSVSISYRKWKNDNRELDCSGQNKKRCWIFTVAPSAFVLETLVNLLLFF